VVLGEKNVSHLRRFGFLVGDATQRLRTGLISAAPPALRIGDAASNAWVWRNNMELYIFGRFLVRAGVGPSRKAAQGRSAPIVKELRVNKGGGLGRAPRELAETGR